MTTELFEAAPPSRYVIGIDLGTTNSAVAYVDTLDRSRTNRIFAIPQLTAPGEIEARETLPSFHYQFAEGEGNASARNMPWWKEERNYCVGVFARDQGTLAPGRLIASAKSWLCHAGVDRTAEILPWQAGSDVDRLSPVEASARYLRHMREAWDAAHPAERFADQEITLTIPASFDEVARELTLAAARSAGLPKTVLMEEPQAAFYAWLDKHRAEWETLVSPGQKILVCDIGGGTSDFTLIRVRRGEGGRVQFHRIAVGEHLILGGDNLDLALAHHFERKLTGGERLPPRRFDTLVRSCRAVKETLLGENPPEEFTLTLPGSGSKLIGGALSVKATRNEVCDVLLEGFLPRCSLEDRPASRRSGLQEFGLPYAADYAVTRYLAAFLSAHRHTGEDEPRTDGIDPARPDLLLFNGGMFDSPAMRARLVEVLSSWFSQSGETWRPVILANERLDLAVARGAAYYGLVRRGEGVKIAASLARTYYLGLAGDPPGAMCIIPGNAEPGHDFVLNEHPLELMVSEPVEFPLYVSSTRLADRPGEILPIDREQMTALPPIRTALKTNRRSERGLVPVRLHAKLTEIGTLDLRCGETSGERSWRLEFDIRSAVQSDLAAIETTGEGAGVLEDSVWNACRAELERTFGSEASEPPETLPKRLSEASEMPRDEWPPTLLRRLWEALMELEAGRKKSAVHEARWINLLGFALRPGYGMAADDWRVAESWRTTNGKLAFAAATGRTETLILWRRLSGGLTAGQQRALAEPNLVPLRAMHKRFATSGAKGNESAWSPHEATETLRLLGSLELLPLKLKGEIGQWLLDLLPKKKLEALRGAMYWTLGRLGARAPLYGPLNTVIASESAGRWLETILALDLPDDPQRLFAVVQLARRTHDRYRDLNESTRSLALDYLRRTAAPADSLRLVSEGGELDSETQTRAFGDSLPKGLRLRMVLSSSSETDA